MLIETPYATSYSMATVMLALSVTMLEIYTVEMYLILTLTFRIGQLKVKYKYAAAHVAAGSL